MQTAIETVLEDPLVRLAEQNEVERKQTLGDFLRKLKRRVKLEYDLKERLYEFLNKRNQFVHDFSEISDWDLQTAKGREAALLFVLDLTMLALSITAIFTTVFQVWAKDNFDEEFFQVEAEQTRDLLGVLEKQFGPIARKILAGKNRKSGNVLNKKQKPRLVR